MSQLTYYLEFVPFNKNFIRGIERKVIEIIGLKKKKVGNSLLLKERKERQGWTRFNKIEV